MEEILIGNQTWMAENLIASNFRNGDIIPEAKTWEEWIKANEEEKPAWCYYENNLKNKKDGKLYNWYAVCDIRGLAPMGWHIPSDDEWCKLNEFLGGDDISGMKLKGSEGWNNNGGETVESNFNGMPSGYRNYDAGFSDFVDENGDQLINNRKGLNNGFSHYGLAGFWWSETVDNNNEPWHIAIFCDDGYFDRMIGDKGNGFSVRCIKDEINRKITSII